MKRSRLKLFKATSMTISLLGIIMVIVTILLIAYFGFSALFSSLASNPDTGQAYDDLNALKADYTSLSNQYDITGQQVSASANKKVKDDFDQARLELKMADETINDVNSALTTNQPIDVVNERLDAAKKQLQIAKESLSKVNREI